MVHGRSYPAKVDYDSAGRGPLSVLNIGRANSPADITGLPTKIAYTLRRGVKFSEAEFMQYRKCVGGGPSSKTCPRCASQRAHCTSSRTMPSEVSRWVRTFSLAIGCQKLGQPVPDSNLVFESKSSVSQQIQWYSPSAWLSAYLPVPGRSVPACRAISNCSGVSFPS